MNLPNHEFARIKITKLFVMPEYWIEVLLNISLVSSDKKACVRIFGTLRRRTARPRLTLYQHISERAEGILLLVWLIHSISYLYMPTVQFNNYHNMYITL